MPVIDSTFLNHCLTF